MNLKSLRLFALSCISVLAPCAWVTAAITVVAPTSATNGSAQLAHDITFDILTAGTLRILALNDWVTADSFKTPSVVSPMITLSLNGGSPQFFSAEFYDNLAGSFGAFSSGDGYFIIISGPAVEIGDIVTFHASSYELEAASGFNPQATQMFTGEVFLTGDSGLQLSNMVLIPEPGSFVLVIIGLFIFTLFRGQKLAR